MDLTRALVCACVVAAILGTPAMAQPFQKPTAEHKILATEEGTWDATIKAFTGGPGAEPMVSKGTEVNTVLPGGLWMVSRYNGDFGGVKYEGRGQFGYDPTKKKYIGTWIDSLHPTLTVLEGTYDAKTRTMTYEGESIDPVTNMKYVQKMVTTGKDDGTRHFTLSIKRPGGADELKLMEITYQKRK
jgi:hypothetical protein